MMMNSGNWDNNAMSYAMVETLPDDVSTQIAHPSRYPRGQKTGGSMRVVKPNSANNSPRSSMGRRRTVVADGQYRRRVAIIDQNISSASNGFFSNDGLQVPTRSNRPASWHPSSQQTHQPLCQPSYTTPMYDFNNQFQFMDVPPTPMVYSGYTSPASTFSPLSMPYNGYYQHQFSFQHVPAPCNQTPVYAIDQMPMMEQQTEIYTQFPMTNIDPTMSSNTEWGNFATSGFGGSTAPPTPENFLPIQHPEPLFPSEDSIPYQSLSDTESVGEDLIGVGLYDKPDVMKFSDLDPQLDNYRSLMMPQLIGSGYRRTESTGKGLKLEETWNPPESDEDDDDDDDEQDAEAEDEEEPTKTLESSNVQCADDSKPKNESHLAEASQGDTQYGGSASAREEPQSLASNSIPESPNEDPRNLTAYSSFPPPSKITVSLQPIFAHVKTSIMVQYVITPWRNPSELLRVRDQLYSGSSPGRPGSDEDRRQAVAQVSVWMQRGNCPHLVESTAILMAAVLNDIPGNASYCVRAAYAAAFCRFVTGLLDSHQIKRKKMSMYSIANSIGLPATYVELRHQATHEELPSLSKLRIATQKALRWIWDYYWVTLSIKVAPSGAGGQCKAWVLNSVGEGDDKKCEGLDEALSKFGEEELIKAVVELQATARDTNVLLKCLDLHQRILDGGLNTTGEDDDSHLDLSDSNLEDIQKQMLAMAKELDETPKEPPIYVDDDIQVLDDSKSQGWMLWQGPWVPKPIGVV
ncbi:uncharacterized protein BP5553_03886 [Venustampulla echinocandica]|uniref:Uncharacterized protein n=1 Tax=Venustampulla echinocandica TaxID=2656787 RepID=A0A370TVJ1_9HELO|nr:uncharacterized protein BP5553_03886 [Venustampulla echinocandica]RDL39546.1 hypothetical protein BP5553_03886 [Venustampulla echinocandica]